MTHKRILVTGASGCIGHYLSEALIQETDCELYLLVRNPSKLQVDTLRPGVTVLSGDLRSVEQFTDLLKTIDVAVLAATAWGGADTFEINVNSTLKLLNLLDPDKCQQVIYFSTASVLDRQKQLLPQAGEIGTDYIRSKYKCLSKLSELALAPKITVLFPTLVLGGDAQKPYSHLSSGLPDVAKWINIARFIQADGSFHFIHGRDIAQIVRYLIDNPPPINSESNESIQNWFVIGQKRLTVNQAIEEICTYLDKKIYFRIPLYLWLANVLIVLFRIQMADWDRFCLRYRHLSYENIINPASFGLPNYCPTLSDALKIHGVPGRNLDVESKLKSSGAA